MQTYSIKDMTKGWFIGNFEPAVLKSVDFEAGIKTYNPGEVSNRHYHKESTAVVMILDGDMLINDVRYTCGDIIVVEKNESTELKAITYTRLLVIKTPSIKNDTYPGDPV